MNKKDAIDPTKNELFGTLCKSEPSPTRYTTEQDNELIAMVKNQDADVDGAKGFSVGSSRFAETPRVIDPRYGRKKYLNGMTVIGRKGFTAIY